MKNKDTDVGRKSLTDGLDCCKVNATGSFIKDASGW